MAGQLRRRSDSSSCSLLLSPSFWSAVSTLSFTLEYAALALPPTSNFRLASRAARFTLSSTSSYFCLRFWLAWRVNCDALPERSCSELNSSAFFFALPNASPAAPGKPPLFCAARGLTTVPRAARLLLLAPCERAAPGSGDPPRTWRVLPPQRAAGLPDSRATEPMLWLPRVVFNLPENPRLRCDATWGAPASDISNVWLRGGGGVGAVRRESGWRNAAPSEAPGMK
mmetsp:Transcript_7682/g.19731  ORF Transcript_7682/g.19731 Transcript_7682/m.19731 type:complete len:227 (-) Transcript_7682:117-797(-)